MGHGRLQPEFLARCEAMCDRCLNAADELSDKCCYSRLIDQFAASSTSVGANVSEASDAMSTKDFRKCLGIAVKELAETRFWLRLFVRRQWLTEARTQPLLAELEEIKLILGAILTKTDPRWHVDE
jgi:four helix bundle protein